MPRPLPPWWLISVAVCYLLLLLVLAYCELWGPAPLGLDPNFAGHGFPVWRVAPGSRGERAGIQNGDLVLSVDGRPIAHRYDWEMVRMNMEVGRDLRLEIQRGEERRSQALPLERRSLEEWASAAGASWLAVIGVRFFSLGLAFVIAFSRPRDFVAQVGALFLAAFVTSGTPASPGLAAAWRSLPQPLSALMWLPATTNVLLAPLLFTFSALFPRPLFRNRCGWLLVWLPPLLALPWIPSVIYQFFYRAEGRFTLPEYLLPVAMTLSAAYIVGGILALVLNYRRLTDLNERRRLRLLVAGAAIGWLGPTPMVIALNVGDRSGLAGLLVSPAAVLTSNLLYLAFPLSLAYAVLRHRLFDIRLMIRQGLQYALARKALVSAVPVLGAVLMADLWLHGDEPFRSVLRSRGWIYGGLGALTLVAYLKRQNWLLALDRRFFRERYDAQRLLRQLVEEIREASSFADASSHVVERIEAALHPEFAAIVTCERGEKDFRTLAAAPEGAGPPALPAEGRLVALVRVLARPIELSADEPGWIEQQLPGEESAILRKARVGLIAPIATGGSVSEALMVLGVKRSEEPYTREDQDLLAAAAATLGLVFAGRPTAQRVEATETDRTPKALLKECPQCGGCYDDRAMTCLSDGAELFLSPIPPALAGRYRLERRIGRGGMGTVYQAEDAELGRRVAVKLIREELVGDSNAVARFRREARAAAAFAHPNVVTVYDFGVMGARAYLVMELLTGLTLREELRRQGRLPPARTIGILREVSAAVDAAHRRALVHRDLKPENIFLAQGETGEAAKVLDFGLAKLLPAGDASSRETATRGLLGTLHYMSPEQLRAEPAQPSWDLWALAVIAYEMLTGALPFTAPSAAGWHGPVVTPISKHVPDAPPIWQRFFDRALAPEPERRPASLLAFFKELEQSLAPLK
jgi:hypothetical protein